MSLMSASLDQWRAGWLYHGPTAARYFTEIGSGPIDNDRKLTEEDSLCSVL